MDVSTKSSKKSQSASDNFLFDAIKTKPKHLSVGDGFRFGVGFVLGQLLVALVVGGLAWAIVVGFKLQ